MWDSDRSESISMRRIAQLLFGLLTVLSVLVCFATVVLWIASYRTRDEWQFQCGDVRWELRSHKGRLVMDDGPQLLLEREERNRVLDLSWEKGRQLMDRQHSLVKSLSVANLKTPKGDEILTELGRLNEDLMQLTTSEMALLRQPQRQRVVHSTSHWLIATVTALLPLAYLMWCLVTWKRQRMRRIGGLCFMCGYDLRASSSRCPECGTPIPATATTSTGAVDG
jgi:hypothetical protein